MGVNSPLPTVRSLGFARAIPGGITGFLPSSTMVCHSKGMVDNGFEVIITLNEPTESSPLIQIREMRAYRTEPVEFQVIVVEKNNQLIYHHDDFELRFNVNSANEFRPGPVLFIGKVFGKDINETLACE